MNEDRQEESPIEAKYKEISARAQAEFSERIASGENPAPTLKMLMDTLWPDTV
jgi:hypothetical protein